MLSIEYLEPKYYCSVGNMMGPVSPYQTNSTPLFSETAVVDFDLDSIYQRAISDNELTASEIKEVILDTTDDSIVDRFEFLQLKRYVRNITSTDHVSYLARAVVDGHATNGNIGNLNMWDGADKIFKLLDKWFNGKDLPKASGLTYVAVSGRLFVDWISPTDAKQGSLNDCYFITAIGSIAHNSPGTIEAMFCEIEKNVWVVGFYNNAGTKHFVTVNNELPSINKDSVFASFGSDSENANNELWPALLEKAYVQVSQNWGFRSLTINNYANIEWGDSSRAIFHITSQRMMIIKGDVKDQYISSLLANIPIAIAYKNHTYAFESYDVVEDKFFLRNPYQTKHITLSWEALKTAGIVGDGRGGYIVNII